MKQALAALALAAVLAPARAPAVEVGGVNFPETVTVNGTDLRFNGAGIRRKFVIEVYVGGLYLAAPSSDAEQVIAADQPKRVRMVFLRDVDRKSILGAFRDGFENNSKAQLGALVAKLDQIAPVITDVKKGGEILVTYVPGAGTIVTGPSGQSAKVEGKEFADAMFRNWLGKEPADARLRKRMLGG
jgi:hypothetical protein